MPPDASNDIIKGTISSGVHAKYERFKTAFAFRSTNEKRFKRRLEKTGLATAGALQKIFAIQDLGGDGHVRFQARFDQLQEAVARLAEMARNNPADAYRALDGLKAEARQLDADLDATLGGRIEVGRSSGGPEKSICLLAVDLGRGIRDRVKKSAFPVDSIVAPVEVDITISADLYEKIAGDPLLHQKLQDAASGEFTSRIGRVVELIAVYDKAVKADGAESTKAVAAEGAVLDAISGMETGLTTAVTGAVLETLRGFHTTKADYKLYKIKTAVKMTSTVIGITSGLVGMATSPLTMGAGAVVGAWGLLKSAVSLGKQIADLASSAEDVYGNAISLYETSKKGLEKHGKAANTGKEVGAKTLSFLLGDSFFQGVDAATGEAGLAKNKFQGIDLNCHDLAGKLVAALDKLGEAETELKKATGDDAKKAKKLLVAITTGQQNVSRLITGITKRQTAIAGKVEHCDTMVSNLNKLKAQKTSENFLLVTDIFFVLADLGISKGTGASTADWTKVLDVTNNVADMTNSLVGIANDVLTG